MSRSRRKTEKNSIKRLPEVWHCIAVLPMILFLCFVLAGCGSENGHKEGTPYQVYYLNTDVTTIVSSTCYSPESSPEKTVEELLLQLSSGPEEVGYFPPVSGFTMQDADLDPDTGLLTLDVSEEYKKQEKIQEILVRAAIVRTLCQVDGVNEVLITVDGEPLRQDNRTEIGPMNGEQFITGVEEE